MALSSLLSSSHEQAAVLSFLETSVHYLKEVYLSCTNEVLDDIIELFENCLQYLVLVDIDDSSSALFQSLRSLLAALISDKEERLRSVRRWRPEIRICEEQLLYLVEQGFTQKKLELCLVVPREQS